MGYRDPISTNPGMVLGGLKEGVTPLGWAYAYMTLANDGDRVSGTLAPQPGDSPVAYTEVTDQDGNTIKDGDNDSTHEQVVSESTALEAKRILETVVSSGTGVNAAIGAEGQWGKTGTTENNGDAWFCGATEEVTACVWVGYADSVTPMETLYNGGPVMGGTFPALIWASVVSAWEDIAAEHAAETAAEKAARAEGKDGGGGEEEESYVPETEVEPVEPEEAAPETEAAPEPEAAPEATPEEAGPEAAPAPESGGTGGGITAG
jgi:penicillin-binding protein 1A